MAHGVLPARLGLGRRARAGHGSVEGSTMRPGDEARLATDNVMGLALRKAT